MTDCDNDIEVAATLSAYPPSIQAGIPKLGETPNGWSRHRLDDLLKRVDRPAKLVDSQSYQLVTAKRNRGGIVAREVLRGDQIRTKTQFYVAVGDFLISNRQISHGACGIVPDSLDGALVSNEYTAFHTTELLAPAFLSALSHSAYFQQTCFHSSVGVHVEKLVFRLEDWTRWEFDVPPLNQQRRIVAVLDTWDRAIDRTERLIAAKRRRLLLAREIVFSDIAEAETSLSAVADIATGVAAPQNRDAFAASGKRFVRVSDLAALAGEQPDEPEYLRPDISAKIRVFPAGTLLFAKSGMSARLARIVRLPTEAHLVSHLAAVQAKQPAFQSFIYHWLVQNHPSALAQGDGFPSIRISDIGQLAIPDLSEDQATLVGDALDALEAEVRVELLRLTAMQRQKRGLLNRLLAGQFSLDGRFDSAPYASSETTGAVV